jgi:hypothetical protein
VGGHLTSHQVNPMLLGSITFTWRTRRGPRIRCSLHSCGQDTEDSLVTGKSWAWGFRNTAVREGLSEISPRSSSGGPCAPCRNAGKNSQDPCAWYLLSMLPSTLKCTWPCSSAQVLLTLERWNTSTGRLTLPRVTQPTRPSETGADSGQDLKYHSSRYDPPAAPSLLFRILSGRHREPR